MRWTSRATWVGLLALGGGLGACRGGESEQPPVHLNRNMDTQPKSRAYRREEGGLFADGRMMRAPVEGTVPADGVLDDDPVLTEGVGPDGNPSSQYPASIKVDDAFRAHGRQRFNIYCTPCHGAAGDGKGTVAGRGLVVPPPSMFDPRLKTLPPGKIYQAIKNGVNNNNMPSYAVQIPLADRWAIVAAVRGMQKAADPTVSEEGKTIVLRPTNKPTVEFGAQLYEAKICVTCHNTDETKKVGPGFKGLYGKTESTSAGEVKVDDAYLKESILNPQAKVVTGYPPAMPTMPFTDIEVQSLILFIKSLK